MPISDPTTNPVVGDPAVAPIPLSSLTEATIAGGGAFDVLMRATKAHLEQEFDKNRIKGPEYSTVYLGSLEAVMKTALDFVLQKNKHALELELIKQQIANAILEGKVLVAQECKLRAEFDLTMATILKVNAEKALLDQKLLTERAQITAMGVDEDSVVGRQKLLYQAQTAGFTRDAEQKAAKLLVDSWNVRRTTDETGTQADNINMLNDVAIGRVVNKLLAGVGA
jgi:hypothetical protein